LLEASDSLYDSSVVSFVSVSDISRDLARFHFFLHKKVNQMFPLGFDEKIKERQRAKPHQLNQLNICLVTYRRNTDRNTKRPRKGHENTRIRLTVPCLSPVFSY
jgi:hypothetical protein